MIRINLLPTKEIRAEFGRRQQFVMAGASLGVVLVVIVGLYVYQTYQLYGLKTDQESLKKEIEALNIKLKEVGDLQQRVKELDGKVKVIDDLSQKKVGPVKVMESLTSAIPQRLWLTEFKESGGNLSITGLAIDNQTVADFLKALSGTPYFKNVDLVETTQVDEGGVPLKRFSIRSQLLYQPPPPPAPPPPQKAAPVSASPATKEAKKS